VRRACAPQACCPREVVGFLTDPPVIPVRPWRWLCSSLLAYLDTRPLSNGQVSAVDYHMNLSNANAASYPGPGYVLVPACACARELWASMLR
jgi:hypothetical protein